MDASNPNANAIYGALIGVGVAFVVVMGIRHMICMQMQILPADAQEEQQQQQEEDPL